MYFKTFSKLMQKPKFFIPIYTGMSLGYWTILKKTGVIDDKMISNIPLR